MSEEETKDYREHLIEWIDILLKDGIIPQVVNPKAIKSNYIPKQKIKNKIEEIKLLREKEIEELGMSLRGSAIDVLNELLEE